MNAGHRPARGLREIRFAFVVLGVASALLHGCGPKPRVASDAPNARAPGVGPARPLTDEREGPGPGACVVGSTEPESIAEGAGNALVWRKILPGDLSPTAIASARDGELAIAGVLRDGTFEDVTVTRGAWAYVAASFDGNAGVRFARAFGSALGVDRPRPLVVHDAEGIVGAATEAGPTGARERIVVVAFDQQGRERYRRTFAGPRWVKLDAFAPAPDGGVLVAGHFEQGVDGVTVPSFAPARVENAFVAALDTRGRTTRLKVLPTGTILALAAHRTGIALAAQVNGPSQIAGTEIRWVDDRVSAASLVTLLIPGTLEAKWMTPLPGSLARASLAFTASDGVWLGTEPATHDAASVIALDASGRAPSSDAPRGGLVVGSARGPVLVRQLASSATDGGSVVEIAEGARATRLAMNVAVIDATDLPRGRLALLVRPLPPRLHPHCADGGLGGRASIVVLRAPAP